MKFALGLAQAGASFACLVIGATLAGSDGKVAMAWFALALLLQTTGELSLAPIGLSMITKLAPGQIVGFAMGVWFLATAAAQYLAAQLATVAAIPVNPDGSFDKAAGLHAYTHLFGMLAIAAFMSALILVAIQPTLRRWMHGAD